MRGFKKKDWLTVVGIVLMIGIIVALWSIVDNLPQIGDPNSAPNTHVSDYYIEEGPRKTHSPNLVTGVLADFRGFDTLLETSVMFLSGISVAMVLSNKMKRRWDGSIFFDDKDFLGVNIKVVMPAVVPVILLYGVYVLFHGEVSLGGGFQAGALFAMAFIIYTMFRDMKTSKLRVTQHFTVIISGIGVLIYAFVGLLSMFNGGKFLEYSALPIPWLSDIAKHPLGMLLVELGVTIGVMATVITILEAVLERNSINGKH